MLRFLNSLVIVSLIAPILNSATLAIGQESIDDAEIKEVYHNDFENDPSSDPAIQDAGSTLTYTTELVFEGNTNDSGLLVSNRENDWAGIDVRFEPIELQVNQEYNITILGYIDPETEVPEDTELILTTPDTYDWIDNTNELEAGQAYTLEGTYLHTDDEENLAFRVQSNEAGENVDFAVADILITTQELPGTEPIDEDYDATLPDSSNGELGDDNDSEDGLEEEPATNPEVEILYQATFEEGEEGTVGAGATVEHAEGAMRIINRSANWHGLDLPFSVAGMEYGYTYDITISGKVSADEEVPAGAQAWLQVPEEDYLLLAAADFVAGETFVLTDTFTVSNDAYTRLRVQSNDAGENVDFDVTEIIIEWNPNQEPIVDSGDEDRDPAEEFSLIDFENGELNGFEPRDGNEVLVTETDANRVPEDGQYSLHVSNRQQSHQGPVLEVTDYINIGETYEVSVWVKNASETAANITLSSQVGEGSPSYQNITSENVSPEDDWVLLQGTQRYSSVGDGYVNIYVESANPNLEFYIDGIDFQEIESEPLHSELDLPSLSAVYADMFSIGNAISSTDMEGPRLELLNHHHNIVTAENAMKPNELVDDEGNFDFEGANTLVERAFEQGHEVHGHVLVWHSQSPDWHHTSSDGQPLSREVALENMYTHIETVMRNFGPEITSWDVVNEALDGDWSNPEDWQSNLRNTGFLRAIGEDYIYLAFAHARRIADELGRAEMALYYNDYNDHIQPKAQTMYHMIKDINEQWAAENPDDDRKLISGVGMQGHYSININPENVKQSIERFEELGIEIGITELDVTTNTANQYIESELIRQGQIYARLFQIFREHADSIDRVTFWGLNDSNSWRSDRYPLLFDDTLRAKPAYYAVLNPDSFLVEHPLEQTVGNQSYAVYGTPDLGTDELDALWSEAPVLTMNQMQQAHEIHASGNGRVLWDEENLYVLFQVADSVLDASHSEAHEQDSVEAFVNETGEQGFSYFEGVGQYRVNYENVATFNPGQYSEGFESYTNITGTGYVVEMAIPWKYLTPEVGQTIGFDMQINDAVDGGRHGVVAWNDDSGQGWTDPSVFGKLTLVTSLDDVEELTEPDD